MADTSRRPRAPARVVATLLILCVALAPVVAAGKQVEVRSEDYVQGRTDGGRDARGRPVWILSGLFLGPFGLILPWVTSPRVPATSLAGKSADYLEGYQDGYVAKARSRNFMYSFIGFGIWTAAAIAMTVALVRATDIAAEGCGSIFDGCSEAAGCAEAWANWDPGCSSWDPGCSSFNPGCTAFCLP